MADRVSARISRYADRYELRFVSVRIHHFSSIGFASDEVGQVRVMGLGQTQSTAKKYMPAGDEVEWDEEVVLRLKTGHIEEGTQLCLYLETEGAVLGMSVHGGAMMDISSLEEEVTMRKTLPLLREADMARGTSRRPLGEVEVSLHFFVELVDSSHFARLRSTAGVRLVASEDKKQLVALLKEAFDVCDVDGGGSIEVAELRLVLRILGYSTTEEEASALCKRMDADGSGAVEWDEFREALLSMPGLIGKVSEEDLRRAGCIRDAFDACDADGSGEIDRDELVPVLAQLGLEVTAETMDAIMGVLDADGDGTVSWLEFLSAMAFEKLKAWNVTPERINGVGDSLLGRAGDPTAEDSERQLSKLSRMEKLGASYLRTVQERRARKGKADVDVKEGAALDGVLSEENLAELRYRGRRAVAFACLAGVLSATIGGLADLLGQQLFPNEVVWPETDFFLFYLLIGGATVVASIFEITLMYRTALRAAMSISTLAGLKLWPVDSNRAFVTAALARAALEIPHPSEKTYDIDPLSEAPRWKLYLRAVLYKGKTGLTSFLLKLLLKRVFSRAAAKSFLPFVSIPVNAFWNTLVIRKVMKASRVCALGPGYSIGLLDTLLNGVKLSPLGKVQCVRAVGCSVARKGEFHPNLIVMLRHVRSLCTNLPRDPVTRKRPVLDKSRLFFCGHAAYFR
eukprot:PLAT12813.1.p1 GENE.PLAT12813.1~~PLAT12813.1.p1  ORF type:complete len:737 (-),score=303.97 PLAT12813.1:332-2383(-)